MSWFNSSCNLFSIKKKWRVNKSFVLQLVGFVNLGLLIFLYSTKYTSIKFVNNSFYPHLFFICATTAIIHIWAILCLLSLFTKCSFIFFYSFIRQCYQIEPFKIVFWSLNTSFNHIFSTLYLIFCVLYINSTFHTKYFYLISS